MQRKLVALFMAVLLAFVVLIGRLTYIIVAKGGEYTKIVLNQQNYDSRMIKSKRGDITDRNGTKIATSQRVYNVILDVSVLCAREEASIKNMMDKGNTERVEYIKTTKEVLKECFGIKGSVIDKEIEENPESQYSILTKGIDYETAKKFEKMDENDDKYPGLAGVWLEEDYVRSYPYGSLASDVIGFTYDRDSGAVGIENAYNEVLNGTDGRKYGYFESDFSLSRTVKAPKNGNTVVSTIDVTLQNIVEECIAEFNGKLEKNGEQGSKNTAVIIMDPSNGEILAEASYPNFDLNDPRDMSAKYTDREWEEMDDDIKTEILSNLWRNFCVSDAFEPGSTMKPFTVAAALETGTLKGDETYYCGGYKNVLGTNIGCHYTRGHGMESIQDGIAYSCNVVLMDIAEAMGVEQFSKYQHVFGFGEYTGIDLPGEADTSGLLFSADSMSPVDLATNSFGQSFNVTMTQMSAAFCSLINGGYYYEPHIVKQIIDENGNVVETKDPVLLKKTVSKETSDTVKTYMKAVMDYGTAKNIQFENYEIGAKTGTAEKLPRGNGKYLLSYIGYAPQENPEVMIYVVVDEPNVEKQDNSALVLELSQSIIEKAFPYLGITTIEQSEQKTAEKQAQMSGNDFSNTQYTDYDRDYEDTYDNPDGNYENNDYNPDLDDWATRPGTTE